MSSKDARNQSSVTVTFKIELDVPNMPAEERENIIGILASHLSAYLSHAAGRPSAPPSPAQAAQAAQADEEPSPGSRGW